MRNRRWIILAVLFAARAATGFQFQSVGSATNLLMQDLGLSFSQIGMLLGAYLLPASSSHCRPDCSASAFGKRRLDWQDCC